MIELKVYSSYGGYTSRWVRPEEVRQVEDGQVAPRLSRVLLANGDWLELVQGPSEVRKLLTEQVE